MLSLARTSKHCGFGARATPRKTRGAVQQGLAADKGRLELGHTLLSAVGQAGFSCEALVKVGPLQLKPSVELNRFAVELRGSIG